MKRCDGGFGDLVETEGLAAGVAGGVAVAVGDERLPRLGGQAAGGLDRLDIDDFLLPIPDTEAARNLRDRRGAGPRLQVVEDGADPGDTRPDCLLFAGVRAGRERLPEHLPDILKRKECFERLLNLFFHRETSQKAETRSRTGIELICSQPRSRSATSAGFRINNC